MDQGFSLTEVLVSLLLMTTTSLALLQQQWQVSQLFNQIHTRVQALSQLDNATEKLQMGYDVVAVSRPFNLQYFPSKARLTPTKHPLSDGHALQIIHLQLTWVPPSPTVPACCTLERRLMIGIGDDE